MNINAFRNVSLFFEDIEGLIEGKGIFCNHIRQNIALLIVSHIINILKDATYIFCYIMIALPLFHRNYLLNGAQCISRKDIYFLVIKYLHVS
jgi:hypothetical protein